LSSFNLFKAYGSNSTEVADKKEKLMI